MTVIEEKYQRRKKEYCLALKSIYKIVGVKEIGGYTADDAKRYLEIKYNASPVSFCECLDYIFYAIPESDTPVQTLTEGYVSDKDCCAIYILPPLKEQGEPKARKNGAVLILDAVDNRIDSWWGGGNGGGYNIKMEMLIFCGKSQEEVLSACR
ncbi:MAG: hypothetical protein LUD27_07880 [Clostridia bacterium]|nr:hypothetical protein [Clostridia bacterium]